MSDTKYFDLSKVQPDQRPLVEQIVKQVRIVQSAWSIGMDINECAEYLGIIINIIENGNAKYGENKWDQDRRSACIVQSLIKSSIIAYCRAVDSDGENRRAAFPLSSALVNDDLKSADRRIKLQRNRSIAHHGYEDEDVVTWHNERPTLVSSETTGKSAILYAHSRYNLAADAYFDLSQLVDAVSHAITHWHTKAEDRLKIKLKRAYQQGIIKEIAAFEFLPAEFFAKNKNSSASIAEYYSTSSEALGSQASFNLWLR